jgi:hypothetical protein
VLEGDVKPDAGAGLWASVLDWTINILAGGFLLLAIIFLILWLIPHSHVKALLDSFAAGPGSDGKVAHPTEGGLNAAVERLPFAFGFLSLCGLSLVLLKIRLKNFFLGLLSERAQIREAFRTFLPPGIEKKIEITTVLFMLGIGIFLRVWHLSRPIHYDEASTYLNYASVPLHRALSNYSYPNNHLLNTLLAHMNMVILGHKTFALRLPALIAGCLVIPAAWLAGRIIYNREAAILTAGCVAAMPTFIEYSINARGYALQWFFMLLMISCAAILCRNLSLNTAWLTFVLAAVAGTYCVPTMIIPIMAIVLWMLLSVDATRNGRPRGEILTRLAWAILAIALVSAVLYLPPILGSGPAAIFSNRFVASRATPFWEGLPPLAQGIWVRWSDGVPAAIIWALVIGAVIGLVWHRRVSTQFVPLTLILFVWSFAFAWLRNVIGYPRVWNYLLLAAVMTATAGWSLILSLTGKRSGQLAIAGAVSLLFTIVVGANLIHQDVLFRSNETLSLIDTREVIEFLRTQLNPGTALVVRPPADPIIAYELLHADKKLFMSLPDLAKADRVIVVLPKPEVSEESYTSREYFDRLASESSAPASEAAIIIDIGSYDQPSLLAKFLSVTIYSFQRKRI